MKVYIGPYEEDQKIEVELDDYDTWNMDCTLALVILPMLKQLKEQKAGAPYIHNDDAPEEFRTGNPEEPEDDPHWFDRWDWVLNEMIWAFEHIADDDWQDEFLGELVDDPEGLMGYNVINADYEALNAAEERIKRGTTLFGKYYMALWT